MKKQIQIGQFTQCYTVLWIKELDLNPGLTNSATHIFSVLSVDIFSSPKI